MLQEGIWLKVECYFLWCSKFLEEKKDKGNFGNERSEARRTMIMFRTHPLFCSLLLLVDRGEIVVQNHV